jgi:uncharacterized membrane protein
MRANTVTALAGGLVLAIAACTGNELPSGPADTPGGNRAELSVVTFGLTTLGDPTRGSGAQAINELGQVLMNQGPSPSRPFVWTNGSLAALLFPFDARRPQAFDLNADAVVVGDVDGQAAAWVNGELTMLSVPADVSSSQAFAINDAGQIAGQAFLGTDGTPSPVLWQDKDQEMVVLAGGLGKTDDINNAGEIVGLSLDEGQNFLRAAYWASSTAEPVFLKGPNGQPCGAPYSINDRSEIVGFCGVGAAYWAGPAANAVAVSASGSATRINELGQIVGLHGNSQFDTRPVLWQQEGTAYREFDLGVPTGYEEGFAFDLNNHGQAAGSATTEATDGVGVLWQIPVRFPLDVVPGSASSIKLGGTGNVAAALLGSTWLHAGDIDPNTLTLGNDNGSETPIARKKGAAVAKLTDVNRDGDLDLAVEFSRQAMTKAGDLVAGSQVLVLQGRLRDGTRLRAADQVTGVR